MKPEQAHEWSRHYDSIQWSVTGILTTAIGGLLAYVYTSGTFDRVLAAAGVVLTLLSVFFASSFRSLRRKLHAFLEHTDATDVQYLRSHSIFRQWPVHLLLHSSLIVAWCGLAWVRDPTQRCVWSAIGVLSLLFIWVWGALADRIARATPASKGSA